jgi:cell division septation protein DedD
VEQEVGGSSPPNCTTRQTSIVADVEATRVLSTQRETGNSPRLAIPLLFTHNSSNSAFGGFMLAVQSRKFQLGLMLATALSISMWPAASQAYTPEQEQACTGDAFRLCGPEIPDVDRVTACMVRNKSQLSPGCRAQFRPEPEPEAAPVAARKPLSIKPAARKPVGAKPKKPKKPAKPAAN